MSRRDVDDVDTVTLFREPRRVDARSAAYVQDPRRRVGQISVNLEGVGGPVLRHRSVPFATASPGDMGASMSTPRSFSWVP